jgi:hypothetical protein
MAARFPPAEKGLLESLDRAVRAPTASASIDRIADRVERILDRDADAVEAWEPIPLEIYGRSLPPEIRSSWVFVLRAGATTGAERHPNSHQRMTSWRGGGDFRVHDGERWRSNFLVSDPAAPLASRWVSIPHNVWHQGVVPEENWVVVSFHTVPAAELIEERPDAVDPEGTRSRKYLEVRQACEPPRPGPLPR